MKATIRRPSDAEHDAITDRLLWPAFQAAEANDPEYSELADDARQEAGDPTYWTDHSDRVLFVAERDGNLEGNVTGGLHESPPLYARGPYANCDGLYVRPEHRREGIASALFERFEEWAADRGAEYVGLSVHVDREPAREFYADRGYEVKFHTLRKPIRKNH